MLELPVALDKRECQVNIVFLFLQENIVCGYLLEAPDQGISNEYHNIHFYGEIRKIFRPFFFLKSILTGAALPLLGWEFVSSVPIQVIPKTYVAPDKELFTTEIVMKVFLFLDKTYIYRSPSLGYVYPYSLFMFSLRKKDDTHFDGPSQICYPVPL